MCAAIRLHKSMWLHTHLMRLFFIPYSLGKEKHFLKKSCQPQQHPNHLIKIVFRSLQMRIKHVWTVVTCFAFTLNELLLNRIASTLRLCDSYRKNSSFFFLRSKFSLNEVKKKRLILIIVQCIWLTTYSNRLNCEQFIQQAHLIIKTNIEPLDEIEYSRRHRQRKGGKGAKATESSDKNTIGIHEGEVMRWQICNKSKLWWWIFFLLLFELVIKRTFNQMGMFAIFDQS